MRRAAPAEYADVAVADAVAGHDGRARVRARPRRRARCSATESATEAAPLLVALVVIAAVSSALEWNAPAHSRPWIPVGEAFLVAVLLASAPVAAQPPASTWPCRRSWPGCATAGSRPSTPASSPASPPSPTLAVMSDAGAARDRVLESAPWLVIGLGVGLLASWQSRSMRDLEARQAPYVTANQLMSQLHALASRGTVGLDSVQLAAELETALRAATGADAVRRLHPRTALRARPARRRTATDVADAGAPIGRGRTTRASRPCWLRGGEQRLGLRRPGARRRLDRRPARRAPKPWPTSSSSASTPPCSSTTCA